MSNRLHNLGTRLRLLQIALTHRFVWQGLVDMARGYGMDYTDVRGNLGPLDLAERLGTTDPIPPPAGLGRPEDFTPPGAPFHFHSEPSVSRFLYQLAHALKARTVIELGCFTGWSTAHLALAAGPHAGRIWAVDPSSAYLGAARANLHRLGLDGRVEWVEAFSTDPSLLARLPRNADIIFLDTSHAYPETRDEVRTFAPLLAPRGCFVLHDAISAPGVRRSLDELAGEFDCHRFATENGHGVAVLFLKHP